MPQANNRDVVEDEPMGGRPCAITGCRFGLEAALGAPTATGGPGIHATSVPDDPAILCQPIWSSVVKS